MQTISSNTWARLVAENQRAHENGWARLGVFATGVGPDYEAGADNSLLYVGSSAGPLGSLVGSDADQRLSSASSTTWMISRQNQSAFWQMVEQIDRSRCRIAWTNVCKMDRVGDQGAPKNREWRQIKEVCLMAMEEEMLILRPKVVLFAISEYLRHDTLSVLYGLGFVEERLAFEDGWTTLFSAPTGQKAILTRHPQGWPSTERDRVIKCVTSVLS